MTALAIEGSWESLHTSWTALKNWDNCLLAKTLNIRVWPDWILFDKCPPDRFVPLTMLVFARLFTTRLHSTGQDGVCSRLLTRLAVGKRALARSTSKISRRNLGFHVSLRAMIYQDVYHHQQLKQLYASIKSYLQVYTVSSALLHEHPDLISFATFWSKGQHTTIPCG